MTKRELQEKAEELQVKALDLEDAIDDLLIGFKFWRAAKVGEMEWDTHDEMFSRWVEAKHDV